MKLRTTAVGIICATFFGLFVLLYALFLGNIQSGFDRLERQAVAENLERVRNALARDLENLDGMAGDWALWDDTYQFLRSRGDAYVKANITPQSLGELRLDLLALFDTDGRLVLARLHDPVEGVLADAGEAVAAMVAATPGLLRPGDWDERRSGLLLFEGTPCLVAARSVLTSNRQGPSAGTLLMGQLLDADRIKSVSELTRIDARLFGLADEALPPRVTALVAQDDKAHFPVVAPLGKTVVAGYAPLRDLTGKTVRVLSIRLPRTIHEQGLLLERAQVGSLVATGIIFGLALLYFVEKTIVSRITGLTADIEALGQGTRQRVRPLSGTDEMAGLARAINTMLDDLDTARARYAMAARAAKVGVWALHLEAGTLAVDPVISEVLGYAGTGAPEPLAVWRDRIPAPDRKRLERFPQDAAWRKDEDLDSEVRLLARDGSVRWFLVRGRALAGNGRETGQVMGTAVDITELKLAAESIRALSGQLMRAQEAERSRIARDLHDNVAQELSSLKIACETLFDDLPEAGDESRRRLDAASRLLARTIGSVRELSYGLRPPDLDHLGLAQALRRLCEDFGQASGLGTTFSEVGLEGLSLDPELAINVYRIAQEALANARKHARATTVSVRLVESYPRLILRVGDDGQGFDPAKPARAADAPPGMGLINMRERAGLLGGSLRILSGPGLGTTVVAEIPYAGALAHDAQTPADR